MAKIRMPDGAVVAFPDDMPKEQIRGLIAAKFPDAFAPQLNPQFATAGTEAPRLAPADPNGPRMTAADKEAAKQLYLQQMNGYGGGKAARPASPLTEGTEAGLMLGFDDEIGAAMTAPVNAGISWLRGDGFDIGKEYERTREAKDLRKEQRREAYPKTSIAGEFIGGAALGGQAAKNGLTLFGRAALGGQAAKNGLTLFGRLPGWLAAPTEAGAYGAAYGAGEAKPGERLEGAKQGAVTGAVTGAVLHGAGKAAERLLTRPPAMPAAPSAEALADDASKLYKTMRSAGISVKPAVVQKLKMNVGVGLGGTNAELAPKAFGLQRLLAGVSDNPTLESLHNFAKSVNRVLRSRMEGEDAHYVGLIKNQIEGLIDGITARDLTAPPGTNADGIFRLWKHADGLWARSKKTEVISAIIDQAEVDGAGRYTQSGLANAIRREMNALYKRIQKGVAKGWSEEEVALIRQMARGGSNSQLVNLLAKFAPRGVVSAIGGFALGGPGLTVAGHLAGSAADRAAVTAATTLRDAAARGYVPMPIRPQIASKLDLFAPGLTAGVDALRNQLLQP
jgi:hypothetical protein